MSLDFLRSPDDERVEAILHRQSRDAMAARPEATVGDCPRCGTVETLLLGRVCHRCDDDARDSQASRALCALLHRGGA